MKKEDRNVGRDEGRQEGVNIRKKEGRKNIQKLEKEGMKERKEKVKRKKTFSYCSLQQKAAISRVMIIFNDSPSHGHRVHRTTI